MAKRVKKANSTRMGRAQKPGPRRELEVVPARADKWRDLERLFGENGACGGCWCMTWRLKRSDFEKQKGAGNKRALKRLVESGKLPGVIAYLQGRPAGWCAVAPREEYPVLGRSRVLSPVDEQPVWSISCFFIAREFRSRGVTRLLLEAALKFAGSQGAKIVEGYPHDLGESKLPPPFVWTGLLSSFMKTGFAEVARRSARRPIMRKVL
jgi:GNAT superfamily N-acetyltransferase